MSIPQRFGRWLILILASAAIILISYNLSRNSRLTPLAPESSSQIPASTWKTYRNEEYGFEIKYHPEMTPIEFEGSEEIGQFSNLLSIQFGLAPLKNLYGYILEVSNKSLEDYRLELIGHYTDIIESEEHYNSNGILWTIMHYQQFISTDYVSVITAFTTHDGYSYAITTIDYNIDQILSTFKFNDETNIE